MNEHFVPVKVDREERPDVDGLYMDAVVAHDRARRLADDRLPDAGRPPLLRRHLLPAGAAARHAQLRAGARRPSPRPTGRGAHDLEQQADVARRGDPAGERAAAVRRAADERPPERRRPGAAPQLRPAARAASAARPSSPPPPRSSSSSGCTRRTATTTRSSMARADARPHGRRRHVRPARRRLPPLLGGRGLARPPLREDALRQRAPRLGVPPRLGRDGRRALPPRGRGDARLRPARAASPGGRLRLGPGRGHRRRRGPHVHVDAEESSRPCSASRTRSGCVPSSTAASSSAGEIPEDARATLLAAREERPQPLRDDKALAAWNGLALAALAEAGARLERPDYVDAAVGVAEFLLGPLSDERGRLLRSYRDGDARIPAYLEDYANVAERARRAVAGRPASCAGSRRHAALAGLSSSSSPTRTGGGFYVDAPDGDGLVARRKEFDDHPTPAGNSMARVRPPAPGAHLRRRRARAAGGRRLPRSRTPSGARAAAVAHLLCALDLHFAPPREIAVVGGSEELRRAALAGYRPECGLRLLVGAHRRRPPSRRQGAASTGGQRRTSASASPANGR